MMVTYLAGDSTGNKERKGRRYYGRSLSYRLSILLVILYVPLYIISLLIISTALYHSSGETRAASQRALDTGMKQMQNHFSQVEQEMQDFIVDYADALETDEEESASERARMLHRIEQIMNHTGEVGFAFLYNNNTGKLYIIRQNLNYSSSEIAVLEHKISLITGQEHELKYAYRRLDGYSFLDKSYFFRNYQVAFLFDLGDVLADNLNNIYEEVDSVFVKIYSTSYQLDQNGILNRKRIEWEDNKRDDLRSYHLIWKGEEIPVELVVNVSTLTILRQIPIIYWIFLVLSLVGFGICIYIFWSKIQGEVIHPLKDIETGMNMIQDGAYDYRIEEIDPALSSEMKYMMRTFNVMAAEVQESREKDIRMLKAELDNLRLQVNPHMLLNSYNMIYSLAQSKNYECIQKYTLHLVDYFRYVLRRNEDMVPLSQEMKFVENYIEIQKIRYPNAFSAVYSMEEDCSKALVPPLLIQNFVENAMKYSLVQGTVVEVLMNVRRMGDRLLISIVDTGKGIKPEILEVLQKGEPYYDRFGNKHIGVWNCRRRIELFYQEEANITITSTLGEGTQVFLDLPYIEQE